MNMTNEPLNVQQSLLASSSEMDKLPCIINTDTFSRHQNYRDGDGLFRWKLSSDGEFQLTEN